MRGKVLPLAGEKGCAGITPAYAGKSQWAGGFVVSIGDHPRICGEKPLGKVQQWFEPGSPPHMRGKVREMIHPDIGLGITPAYAGKSAECSKKTSCKRDHPRICGEKCSTGCAGTAISGSPPHMRGKAVARQRRKCVVGITPAYAGKRAYPLEMSLWHWDHPRICGEKSPPGSSEAALRGSPPHMRGKAVQRHIP